ncbi:MAG: carbohydrate-binding family 9-like protein, partial [Leadbetterella sp.]
NELTAIIQKVKAISTKESEDVQWRIKQITLNWDFTVLTLRAIEAGKKYRMNPNPENFKVAFDLGKQRDQMISNPENCFSISPKCVSSSDANTTMNILSQDLNLEKREVTVFKQDADFKLGELNWPQWEPISSPIGRKMDKQEFRNNLTSQKASQDGFTMGRLFYTEKGLYVALNMAEPKIDSIEISKDPKDPWKGDCVELFFNPSGSKDEYFQFVVNPNGLGKAIVKKGDVGFDKTYDPKWKYTAIKGKTFWTVQIFIPWEDLGGKPKDGDSWGANFYRTKWKPDYKEYLAWAPTGTKLFAMPELFGKINFGGKR